jgi:hypothetical protein
VNPLTESRQAIAEALVPLGVTIYGAPPENVSPPAAVVVPGQDWFIQATFASVRVQWQVTLMATMQGANVAALERLEQLLWDATALLETVGTVGPPTSPRILKVGAAEVAATDLIVNVHVSTATEGAAP